MVRLTAKPDWQAAERQLRASDPVLAVLIERIGPCTLTPDPDPCWSLCEAIICQQVSSKAGESICRRFRALFPGGRPEPEALAALDAEALRSAGVSPQKQSYLKDLACHCLAGSLALDRLPELSAGEIARELLAVKGIGPWTVTMFLIFALNRTDVLPVGDLGFRRAVQLAYGLPALPDEPTLREIAGPWHPYESIATWYLWRSLENK